MRKVSDMTYTEYTKMTTEELLTVAFTSLNVDSLALELAQRLTAIQEEIDDLTCETVSLEDRLVDAAEENHRLAVALSLSEDYIAQLEG